MASDRLRGQAGMSGRCRTGVMFGDTVDPQWLLP